MYPNISNNNLYITIFKGGFICYTTTGSGFKAINLILKYINALDILNIKYNRNCIHIFIAILLRNAFNKNYLIIIRKSVKMLF